MFGAGAPAERRDALHALASSGKLARDLFAEPAGFCHHLFQALQELT